MNEDIVLLETAKLAFDAGFDWPCYFCYSDSNNEHSIESAVDFTGELYFGLSEMENDALNTDLQSYLAPTQDALRKWLMEVHNIYVLPYVLSHAVITAIKSRPSVMDGYKKRYQCNIYRGDIDQGDWTYTNMVGADSYQEVLELGLQDALNLIKDGN